MSLSSMNSDDSRSFDHELAGKYLTFSLGEEHYGLPIKPINDIIELQDYTEIPQTADYVRGVINLRGTVIPVIDLREKFGLPTTEYDEKTCIVVVNIENIQTGLIIDRVEEVREFSDKEIDPSPKMSSEIQVEFIAGIGKKEEEVYILLDIDRIIKKEELDEIKENIDD